VRSRKYVRERDLDRFRTELFGIREEMLSLMKRFRN
jgi:hypothetical protein